MSHEQRHHWAYTSSQPARHHHFICPLCSGEGWLIEEPESGRRKQLLEYKHRLEQELRDIDGQIEESEP